ncbi:glutamate racemase [Leeia oryzae]|uniref:glutamate racemase n=1 Tax=Leeia oryzae TaxID=356662 RepID=UPI00039E0BB1|nr:glutamate racemase [Leeia oryzae]
MKQQQTQPIGVFDSGLGGLSVLQHLKAQLPAEHLIYVADSAHVPYGSKSAEFICARSFLISDFLIGQGCKALVIACNTATAAAAGPLRARYTLPIIGMEPAVKPAVQHSKNKIIGVLATEGTLKSAQFAALLDRFGQDVHVVTQPCPGLPELVEAGELDTQTTRSLLQSYMRPLTQAGVDTIVLGCTHYPFLAPLIQEMAGPDVVLIDTGTAVARHTKDRLTMLDLLNPGTTTGQARFFSSQATPAAQAVVSRLWGEAVTLSALPG